MCVFITDAFIRDYFISGIQMMLLLDMPDINKYVNIENPAKGSKNFFSSSNDSVLMWFWIRGHVFGLLVFRDFFTIYFTFDLLSWSRLL